MSTDTPWTDEPDELSWADPATGYDCCIVRNDIGALCGYVQVPEGHPWHGDNYDEHYDVEVHGGLTFAGVPDGKDTYHLGFDCAHSGDLCPQWHRLAPLLDVYRDIAYVKAECANLAAQIKAGPDPSPRD